MGILRKRTWFRISNKVINNRRKYNTSLCQKAMSVINPLLFCETKRARKHNNAEKKLHEELDWIEIIKSIRELKVLTKLILSQHQRQLLAFQKNNVITNQPPEKKEEEYLEHWMPFENTAKFRNFIYRTRVNNVIEHMDKSSITAIDKKLIEEITGEKPEESDNHQLPRGKNRHHTYFHFKYEPFLLSETIFTTAYYRRASSYHPTKPVCDQSDSFKSNAEAETKIEPKKKT